MGDDVPLGGLLALLGLLLLLSAFFSGSETALMSLNRYQLRHRARKGHRGAILAERLLARPDRVIGLILLVRLSDYHLLHVRLEFFYSPYGFVYLKRLYIFEVDD